MKKKTEGEETMNRLSLLQGKDPDQTHLERGTDSEEKKSPKVADGPALSEREDTEREGEERERERHTAWMLTCLGEKQRVRKTQENCTVFTRFNRDRDQPTGERSV